MYAVETRVDFADSASVLNGKRHIEAVWKADWAQLPLVHRSPPSRYQYSASFGPISPAAILQFSWMLPADRPGPCRGRNTGAGRHL